MTILEAHPYAEIFPMISGDDFDQLKADIECNGVQNFGLLYEGKILDGRNRYKACCELGIEMTWCEVELGEDAGKFDPEQYVLSQNLYRRHLDEGQRGMVAAKLAKLKHGHVNSQKTDGPIGPSSIADASKKLKVGTSTTKRAKNVIKNGCKELQELVERGELSVSKAEEIANGVKCPEEQMRVANEFIESPRKKSKPRERIVKEDFTTAEHDRSEEESTNNLAEFKKLWKKCSQAGKVAIRIWIDENYLETSAAD